MAHHAAASPLAPPPTMHPRTYLQGLEHCPLLVNERRSALSVFFCRVSAATCSRTVCVFLRTAIVVRFEGESGPCNVRTKHTGVSTASRGSTSSPRTSATAECCCLRSLGREGTESFEPRQVGGLLLPSLVGRGHRKLAGRVGSSGARVAESFPEARVLGVREGVS